MMPEERPVDNPTPMGRPVDVQAEEPMSGARPVDDEAYEPMPVGFNNPFFGAPIAFAQCQNTSGMDTTTTLPIYSIPEDSSIGIDQSAVPTVYASGVSPVDRGGYHT